MGDRKAPTPVLDGAVKPPPPPAPPPFRAVATPTIGEVAVPESVDLRRVLLDLRLGRNPDCWCEVAIGNPNYRGVHTAACLAARAAVTKGVA